MGTPELAARIARSPLAGAVDTVLRGVGQVFLQNNPFTGAFFLLGIFLSSWTAGVFALLGTIVSTGTAVLLGVPRSSVRNGLYGFNGTLTAIDLSFFIPRDWSLIGYVVLGCVASSILTAALENFLNTDHIPGLTAAFVGTTWVFLAALRQFAHLHGGTALRLPPHLPPASTPGSAPLLLSDLVPAFFNGFAQVMLQYGWPTGLAFFLGILVNSRISAAAAAAGSLLGLGTGWALGLPTSWLRDGLSGYNSVLTVIALAGLYYLLTLRSVLYAALGGILTVVVVGMFATVLAPFGLPLLTAPFVVTTWVYIFAAPSLTRLRHVHPQDAITPEANLRAAGRPWPHLPTGGGDHAGGGAAEG